MRLVTSNLFVRHGLRFAGVIMALVMVTLLSSSLLMPQAIPVSAGPAAAPAAGAISLSQPVYILLNGTNTVNVQIDGASPGAGAFEFDFGFNKDIVNVNDIVDGGWLASTGRQMPGDVSGPDPWPPVLKQIDNVNGTAGFGSFTIGNTPDGPTAGGTMATITLQGKKAGISDISLSNVLLTDINGNTQATDVGTGYQATVYSFVDVLPSSFNWMFIERLYNAGITGGCGTDPGTGKPLYCPTQAVNRRQMAVFLLRGIHGANYTPPPATGTVYTDVPANSFNAAWIEQLAAEGITGGCATNPPQYCPTQAVNRRQMAVFLLRAKYGSVYNPPPATGTVFTDVPANSFNAAWIEQLAVEGITGGCATNPPQYCPTQAVNRRQMAVFLVRTFNLPELP